jgi:ABC-type transport system involved in multi-copper enzyme maturation permease subunit
MTIESTPRIMKTSKISHEITRFIKEGLNLLSIFMIGFFRSRKSQLLLAIGMLPVIVVLFSGVVPTGEYPAKLFYIEFSRAMYITLLIPLFGLLLGTAALSDEIETHTIIQIVSRPVKRLEIVIWRYIATVIVGSLIGFISITAFYGAVSITTPIPLDALWGSLVLMSISCWVYSSLFIFLGLAIDKPLIWGVLVTLYEQLLGLLLVFLGGGAFSLSNHITNVGSIILGYSSTIQDWAPADSAILLVTITFVMIALAIAIFQYKDLD